MTTAEPAPSAIDTALQVSTDAFLNSLAREYPACDITGLACTDTRPQELRLPLPSRGSQIVASVAQASRVGYHRFSVPLREVFGNGVERSVELPELATLVAAEPAIGDGDRTRALVFVRRVLDSLAAMEDAIRHAPAADGVFARRDPDFAEAEAHLRFGHTAHPTPRSRDEFSTADARRYAPEYANGFPLRWWAAAPEAVTHATSRETDAPACAAALVAADDTACSSLREAIAAGRVLVPMHPWQAARLALDPRVDALFARGLVGDLGASGRPWSATSSLRSIYAPHAPWMLKVSLSLRLTNSVRVIEPHECSRGVEVDRMLRGPVGRAIAARYPAFHVLGEPAFMMLRDEMGGPLSATAVVFRDNPFRESGRHGTAVLGALCERHGAERGSALGDVVRRIAARDGTSERETAIRWFEAYLSVVVAPLLAAQADYGLLFGAHQQNIVVGLQDGWPVALHFRDCQGTGYVAEFLPQLAAAAPDVRLDAGHVFASEQAARLVGYYLFVNSTFAVIAALASSDAVGDTTLVAVLRSFLKDMARQHFADKTSLDYLIGSRTLMSKGNFMICLRNINENTDVVDPLAGYVEVANPIARC